LYSSRLSPYCIVMPPVEPLDGVPVASTDISASISSSVCSLAPIYHTSALFPAPPTSSPRLFRISAALSLSPSVAFRDSDGKCSMLWPASLEWIRSLGSVAFVSPTAAARSEPISAESPTLLLPLGRVVSDFLIIGTLAFYCARACQYAPHR
jgi:hypothetical protein